MSEIGPSCCRQNLAKRFFLSYYSLSIQHAKEFVSILNVSVLLY